MCSSSNVYLCNGMDCTTTTSAPKLLSSVWNWIRDSFNEGDDLLMVKVGGGCNVKEFKTSNHNAERGDIASK